MDKDIYENDDVNSIVGKVFDFLENKKDIGFKFGIKLFDIIIGGFFKGELIIIVVKLGVGKIVLVF